MTYNIKYANENDGVNSWSNRKNHLVNQLKFHEPDLFGVQEAVADQLEFLKSNLENHHYTGTGRDGGDEGEFNAIFFDTRKFELLQKGTFWLSETPEKVSKGWDAAYPRIASYGLFKKKDTGTEFWVFNTHYDHRGTKARQNSSRLIIKVIKSITREETPFLLMGDLNLEPQSEEVQYLSRELEESRAVADFIFGPEGTFNAYQLDKPVTRRIDYIFLSPGDFAVKKYAVLSDSKDGRYPSDHLPVFLQIELG